VTWLLCTLLGHKRVSVYHTEQVKEPGRCMFTADHTCARKGCKWQLTTWQNGTLA
jgi:hypothetical protein